jgi:hypothetical protein
MPFYDGETLSSAECASWEHKKLWINKIAYGPGALALPPIGLDCGPPEGRLSRAAPHRSLCSPLRTAITRGWIEGEHALGIQRQRREHDKADQFWICTGREQP